VAEDLFGLLGIAVFFLILIWVVARTGGASE